MKKLSDLLQSERFTDILSWVIVIALGIGIVVVLDSLDISKSDKYLVGKGIKWFLILVPWLGLKLYNLFTKKDGTGVSRELDDVQTVSEYDEKPEPESIVTENEQSQVDSEDVPLEKPKESTWSIVLTAIIVATIIFVGSWLILSSCGSQLNEHEKLLVGTWNCAGNDEVEETEDDYRRTYSFDNTFEFQEDGTFLQSTLCKERVYVEKDDYKNVVTFKWEITGKGTWNIERDILTNKLTECYIVLKEIRTAVKKNNDLEHVSQLKAVMEDEIPEWRNSLLEEEQSQVVKLFNGKFVGRNVDDTEYEMVRIK